MELTLINTVKQLQTLSKAKLKTDEVALKLLDVRVKFTASLLITNKESKIIILFFILL